MIVYIANENLRHLVVARDVKKKKHRSTQM